MAIAMPRGSILLAHDLRERILTGEIPPGSALPSERDLVAQTGIGRSTVREALRILEAQGFVTTRIGRSGGAIAQLPGRDTMADAVALLIRGRELRLDDLLVLREAIEPVSARLAARHRTDADIAAIAATQAAIVAAKDEAAFLKANTEWHVVVANASHNELISGLMSALQDAINEYGYADTLSDRSIWADVVRVHERVAEAIRDQDSEAAERRMLRHMDAVQERVRPK